MSAMKKQQLVKAFIQPQYVVFIIPKGLDLKDDTVVEDWFVKHNTLTISFVDKRRKDLTIEYADANEVDDKYPEKEIVLTEEDGDLYEEHSYLIEQQEEEEPKASPTITEKVDT